MKSPFAIITIFAGALVLGIFWFWPSYQELAALQTQEAQKQNQVQMRESYYKDLANIENQLQNSKDQLAKIDAAFPNDANLPLLYGEIQQTASNSGLVLRSISSSVSDQNSLRGLRTIQVDLIVDGSYGALKEFIARASSASRVLDIQSITFSSPKTATQFEFNIKLNAYSY